MLNTFVSHLQRNLFSGVLVIGALASTSYAVAQQVVRVNVPFDFQNGSEFLPAGAYNIEMQPGHVVQIRGISSHASGGFAMARPEQRSTAFDTGKVVFHKYGDHVYLSEVWLANESTGYKCTTSRAEKRDQQLQFAANPTAQPNIEVALNEIR